VRRSAWGGACSMWLTMAEPWQGRDVHAEGSLAQFVILGPQNMIMKPHTSSASMDCQQVSLSTITAYRIKTGFLYANESGSHHNAVKVVA
jgi:hypothetical protein